MGDAKNFFKIFGIRNGCKSIVISVVRFLYRMGFTATHARLYKHPELWIPKVTYYCYVWWEISEWPNPSRVDVCPFHKHTTLFPEYAGTEDLCMLNGDDCFRDDCKTCGINLPKD